MRQIAHRRAGSVADIFLLSLGDDPRESVECVGAVDPSLPSREDKMVLMVSTQFGCPMGCLMCDAGTEFHGSLTDGQIHAQIDWLLATWAGDAARRCRKLKVQFARMGEPSLNDAVLDVLRALPERHGLPGLLPCIASVMPRGRDGWFEALAGIRDELYPGGMFQLQISMQSTSESGRRRMIPAPTMSFEEMGGFAERFVGQGDRKVTLNFALEQGGEFDPGSLLRHFSPGKCLVKLTPLNPTASVGRNGLVPAATARDTAMLTAAAGEAAACGYEVIVSVGLEEESLAGSSCGQLAFGSGGRVQAGDLQSQVEVLQP